jgi:hypothetical protein
MNFIYFFLSLAMANLIPMRTLELQQLELIFRNFDLLPALPTTPSDFAKFRDEGLFSVPLCPMKYRRFSCNVNGSIDWLHLELGGPTAAHPDNYFLLEDSEQIVPVNFTLRNFVGNVASFHVEAKQLLVIEHSIFGDISAFNSPFLFIAPTVVLNNVSMTRFDLRKVFVPRTIRNCSFTNVTLLCPVPDWLAFCFGPNVTSADAPCVAAIPPPPLPLRFLNSKFTPPSQSIACETPPRSGFNCTFVSQSRGYLPQVNGFNVVDVTFSSRGAARAVDISTNGVLARVDLWDWYASSWVRVVDRLPTRTSVRATETLKLARVDIVTNRMRLTFEQWLDQDVVLFFSLGTTSWPVEALPHSPPLPVCPPPVSLSARSMLDDTVGDSFCVGYVCQFACTNSVNFTFGRAVLAEHLIVEGGEEWSRGAWLEMSVGTRIYQLSMNKSDANETAVVDVPGFNHDGVSRVRLVGSPIAGQGVLLPAVPPRKGFPGIFKKRLVRPGHVGGLLVRTAAGGFDGNASAPFPLSNLVHIARVANSTFAFSNGTLWEFASRNGAAPTWAERPAELTRLLLNAGEEPPRRALVGLYNRLLVVVSAIVRLHDGVADPLLVNRNVSFTPIDVLDTQSGTWYPSLVQHDVAHNLSQLSVATLYESGLFFIVTNGSLEGGRREHMLFEFEPFPYNLTSCPSNQNCSACLGSIANEEDCRWCGARCVARGGACMANEESLTDLGMCMDNFTMSSSSASSSTTTLPQSPSTVDTAPSEPASVSQESTSTVDDVVMESTLSSSTIIGLAVGVPLAICLLVALGVGVVVFMRSRRNSTTSTTTDEDTDMKSVKNAENPSFYEPAPVPMTLPPDDDHSESISLTE